MSLLDRLGRAHLDDAALARLWVDGREHDAAHPHLAVCAQCRERYAHFDDWVDGVAGALRDEADDILTPERLAAQQAHIARRLETLDRPARIIAFPKAARAVMSGHSHVRRWVTVAAAASLIAGFSLGQVVPLHRVSGRQPAAAPQPLTKPRTIEIAREYAPATTPAVDDELLTDAFVRSHVASLSALDDMTPHAREASLTRVK